LLTGGASDAIGEADSETGASGDWYFLVAGHGRAARPADLSALDDFFAGLSMQTGPAGMTMAFNFPGD
jgi:hypothetical protein